MTSHLFIVDSSPAVLRLVEQAFSTEGYEVSAFKDGAAALDGAKRLNPEIVIADFHLEDIPFPDFCKQLKKNEHLAQTPIISLISSSDRPDEKYLHSLGVKAFLEKPFQATDLMSLVKNLPSEKEGSSGRSRQSGPIQPDVSVEEAMRGLLDQLLRSITEQAERTTSQLLPDLVTQEVGTRLSRIVQDIVSQHLSGMEAKMRQSLADTAGRMVREMTENLVKEIVEPTVRKHLPDALKQHLGPTDKLVKEAVEEAASQHAHQAAEGVVREAAKEIIEKVARKVVPDLAEAEVKKEIERLTA